MFQLLCFNLHTKKKLRTNVNIKTESIYHFNTKNMNMTFKDHYESKSDERREFIVKIAKLTLATETTVTRWLSGEFTPSKARQEKIARFLKTKPSELWPTSKQAEAHD